MKVILNTVILGLAILSFTQFAKAQDVYFPLYFQPFLQIPEECNSSPGIKETLACLERKKSGHLTGLTAEQAELMDVWMKLGEISAGIAKKEHDEITGKNASIIWNYKKTFEKKYLTSEDLVGQPINVKQSSSTTSKSLRSLLVGLDSDQFGKFEQKFEQIKNEFIRCRDFGADKKCIFNVISRSDFDFLQNLKFFTEYAKISELVINPYKCANGSGSGDGGTIGGADTGVSHDMIKLPYEINIQLGSKMGFREPEIMKTKFLTLSVGPSKPASYSATDCSDPSKKYKNSFSTTQLGQIQLDIMQSPRNVVVNTESFSLIEWIKIHSESAGY